MYKIFGDFDGDLIVYKEKAFFLRVVRLQSWGFNRNVKIFNEKGGLILEYSHFEFVYTRVKILYQKLPLKMNLVRSALTRYNLVVENTLISIKFSLTSLSKKLCEIYLDNKKIATVTRGIFVLKNEIEVFIKKDNDYELYIILLLIISTTTLDA